MIAEQMKTAQRPFTGAEQVVIVLPNGVGADAEQQAQLADFANLVRREPLEFEVELGALVRFAFDDPGYGPRFLIGPADLNPAIRRYQLAEAEDKPRLWLDRQQHILIADAPDLEGVMAALNMLRTLGLTNSASMTVNECDSLEQAIQRIVAEVGWTYPAFALRGLDWSAICERHADRVRQAADPLAAMQQWLAELDDSHTWVRQQPWPVSLPYALWVTPEKATFARVPPNTAAWNVGVRAGDELVDEDTAGWWARTGAPAHAKPLVTGRRLLAGPISVERELTARKPSGQEISWREAPKIDLPFPLVSWRRLPSGTGYLRVEIWRADRDVEALIDAAFTELRDTNRLIVDLRANPGGNWNLACSFRDRFLREKTVLGSVRYSTGMGGLSRPQTLVGEPAAENRRWPGVVRFLTDALTYSASEDALLGLQGSPHVKVVGEPSGGGSGRMRAIPLLPGLTLTVSTALTYDRNGHCVENSGIPVDIHVIPYRFDSDAPDNVLLAADQSW